MKNGKAGRKSGVLPEMLICFGGGGWGAACTSIVANTLVVVASGSSLVPSRSLAPHTGNF